VSLDPTTATVDGVRAEVAAIRTLSGPHCDFEALHGMEDNLHRTVLEAIAIGRLQGTDAQRAALHALETVVVDFPRYTA
jgi:hypothetical protein